MSEEDMKRFWELENKMENGEATEDEMYERDALWCLIQLEEEQDRKNSYQFGY